ncbi:DUF5348 domain-containing protein [Caldinitratiruptor microaerophilus]|uniref:DUF5348 domain-containing protein n=1 Tax=Caldinitratiruptor microaerophilus TaxID=671077 RepID=A0AA35CIG4_9FIRM|nr:DUF5348 domain-containing protein [Caldinitratiruptor microaerophilus]BDG59745.1 hypothetical protein caldi_08350 [Caldinitratiruptor microaerophilus]
MPTEYLSAAPSGRLAVGERELLAGDVIEILVAGRWVPARVEWNDTRREWYAVVPQGAMGKALTVPLWPGVLARLPERQRGR